jgi:hypothetical protein
MLPAALVIFHRDRHYQISGRSDAGLAVGRLACERTERDGFEYGMGLDYLTGLGVSAAVASP